MRKTALSWEDHTKPFRVVLGVVFTFIALIVLYSAFSTGGFDIRSRAASKKIIRTILPGKTAPRPTSAPTRTVTATPRTMQTAPTRISPTTGPTRTPTRLITPTPTRTITPTPR